MPVKYIGDLDNDVMRGRGGGGVNISTPQNPNPPAQGQDGDLWFQIETGRMFMRSGNVWFQLW